jgi:hypothetical protein
VLLDQYDSNGDDVLNYKTFCVSNLFYFKHSIDFVLKNTDKNKKM